MIKILNKFIISLLLILILGVLYLSIFGVNTNKFNDKIISQVVKFDSRLNLKLRNVKILLQPFDLKINLKTLGSTLILEKKKIELESIKTNISILKFIKDQFTIDNLQISTKSIKIKDLIPFVRLKNDSTNLYILEKLTKDGYLISNLNLNFDNSGNFKKDFKINGIVKEGKFAFLKNYNLNNLNFKFEISNNQYELDNINFFLNKIDFKSEQISIKKKGDEFIVKGKFDNNNIDLPKLKNSNLLSNFFTSNKISVVNLDSKNIFSLKINKKFNIKDINLSSEIDLKGLRYKKKLPLQNFFPDLKNEISLKNHKIRLTFKDDVLQIKGAGGLLIQNEIDTIDYDIKKIKNDFHFKILLNLLKNPLSINLIKYFKEKNTNSQILIEGVLNHNKQTQFKSISLEESKNKILIKNLFLNENFKILKMDSFTLNLMNKDKINNQINIKRNKKNYIINGNSFDITEIIKNVLNSKSKEGLSSLLKKDKSQIVINISKVFLDKEYPINNFNGTVNIKNSEILDLNLNSSFDDQKRIAMTIQRNSGEKITTFYSDYAKPIVRKYKFIKGFEEGALDFYSIQKNGVSSSQLKIYDFKLKKLPVLTKILTLASLQGIADILSGEGIRFNEFEMKFNNKKELMTIEEIYAIGPAISILMEGYIQKNELVSLRGTLVPATTINKAIGSIPILGDILVGKTVGEGVFGVSFKIKGPPKKLETTVNPIKTLTPRFITRTLENIKKN